MSATDELFSIYSRRGAAAYYGEAVTMSEHSLQTAYFAQTAAAADALVVAALLHDIGHLLDLVPHDIAEWDNDARHEVSGSRWLAARFGPGVCEPVRLHVPAKRYLCATDSAYFAKLSTASVRTLELQGGPMAAGEIAEFEALPYHRDALLLRHWDDQGKIAGMQTPDFNHYRVLIERMSENSGQ